MLDRIALAVMTRIYMLFVPIRCVVVGLVWMFKDLAIISLCICWMLARIWMYLFIGAAAVTVGLISPHEVARLAQSGLLKNRDEDLPMLLPGSGAKVFIGGQRVD